jgi:hypothetical protein
MTGVGMTHIPFRGGGPAITNLLGGQVNIFFSPIGYENFDVAFVNPIHRSDLETSSPLFRKNSAFCDALLFRFHHYFPEPVITSGGIITPVPGTSQAS